MRRYLLLATALLTLNVAHAAEVYRWVDAHGKVHYSDQPPPPAAKDAQLKKLGTNAVDVDKLPFATRDAVKKNPVILYANNCGVICDEARQLLSKRGIPFTAQNPETSKDGLEALKKLTGATEVPVLTVGSNTLKGFDASGWESALDNAGYPRTATVVAPKPEVKTGSTSSEKTEAKPADAKN